MCVEVFVYNYIELWYIIFVCVMCVILEMDFKFFFVLRKGVGYFFCYLEVWKYKFDVGI